MGLREVWLRRKTSIRSFRGILEKHCDEKKGSKYYVARAGRFV